eukprot:15455974-Alexandrium_andersonii.AAC.1
MRGGSASQSCLAGRAAQIAPSMALIEGVVHATPMPLVFQARLAPPWPGYGCGRECGRRPGVVVMLKDP